MVVLQMNVPQILPIRQLLDDIVKSFTISRVFPDTSASIVADGSRQTGGPFLVLRSGVGTLRSATGPRFSLINSVLDVGCIRGLSSSSSETLARSGRTKGLSFIIFIKFW